MPKGSSLLQESANIFLNIENSLHNVIFKKQFFQSMR